MSWNLLPIPKLQWCSHWSLGIGMYFHPTIYWACDHLSVRGLEFALEIPLKRHWIFFWGNPGNPWLILYQNISLSWDCLQYYNLTTIKPTKQFIVRRAGLLLSQQDFEWRWSVPLFQCLTVLEFSFILFDLCLLITFFNFIMNSVPIVTFWIFTYHKIWILSIMFCFIWSYWIIYFLACL